MWTVEDVTMTLTNSGGLQFRSSVEWKRRVLLQLLQKVTMGEGVRITPLSITVKKGNFLVTNGSNKKLSVFFAYMIGERTYGLYIVDFGGTLAMILMAPGGMTVQFSEVKWLIALGDQI